MAVSSAYKKKLGKWIKQSREKNNLIFLSGS